MNHIPKEYYDTEVYIRLNSTTKIYSSEMTKIINYRLVHRQLNIPLQYATYRSILYDVRTGLKLKGIEMDIVSKTEYGTYSDLLTSKFKDLNERIGIEFFGGKKEKPYWGYVLDYLQIYPDGKSTIIEPNMEESVLSFKNLMSNVDTDFFFITCEKKDVLMSAMQELKDRGYYQDYRGLSFTGKIDLFLRKSSSFLSINSL